MSVGVLVSDTGPLQVHDLQDCVKGKNTNTLEMRQTLVDKERSQDDLLSQLDEKTEKIIEMNHKYLQQVRHLFNYHF